MNLDNHFTEHVSAFTSYIASALCFLQQMPWMSLGAAVLLVARLIQDIPPAVKVIKDWRQNHKQGRLF